MLLLTLVPGALPQAGMSDALGVRAVQQHMLKFQRAVRADRDSALLARI
jgi:hypothetical protein